MSARIQLLVLLTLPFAAFAQPPAPITTLKASAHLVLVDVVVTDKSGQPVQNLKQSDFSVSEDKTPQTISNFEEHSGPAATLPPPLPLPPGVYCNYTSSPEYSATNVLLLDALDTPPADQASLIKQLKQFLETVPPGTRIAIFSLKTRLEMLQGFTSDPKLLLAAFDQKGIIAPAYASAGSSLPTSLPFSHEVSIINFQQIEEINKERVDQALQQRNRSLSRSALEQLARYLAVIPGRKNLIWFAGAFPLQLTGKPADSDRMIADEQIENQRLTNLFLGSRVAIYPVQASGLNQVPGLNMGGDNAFSGPAASAQQIATFGSASDQVFAMQQIAEDTGGRAFLYTNHLAEAVSTAAADGSHYYTIAYRPTNARDDGSFRTIRVKLAQRGLQLAYRRNYYAGDSHAPPRRAAAGVTVAPDHLRSAMVHGAPEATEIIFSARVRPVDTTLEDRPVEGNVPSSKPGVFKGPYRRLQVDLAVDLHPLTVRRTVDGQIVLSLQYSTLIYDSDGLLLNEAGITRRQTFTVQNFNKAVRTGVAYHQQISVPAKGNYFVRIGLRDLTSDHIGSLELPVDAISTLPPPPEPLNP